MRKAKKERKEIMHLLQTLDSFKSYPNLGEVRAEDAHAVNICLNLQFPKQAKHQKVIGSNPGWDFLC